MATMPALTLVVEARELAPGRPCARCGTENAEFPQRQGKPAGRICKACVAKSKRQWERSNPERVREHQARHRAGHPNISRDYLATRSEKALFYSARARAKRDGISFTIALSDIVIPPCCPVFGIAMARLVGAGKGPTDNTPTIDRIDTRRGYEPGNVAVISHRANRMKSDFTETELERLLAWMRAAKGAETRHG